MNQTLINQWLTLWRSQIGAKVKTLNASQENVTKLLRAVQANVSAAAAAVDALASTHGPSAVESYETVVAENERISATVSALEGRLLTQLADAQRHNARLEAELSMASLHHRLELLCCLLLSVSISLVLVALCGAAVRARSATDPGRESPTPVVHRRAAFAQRAAARPSTSAWQHRERLIAAARAEPAGGDAPASRAAPRRSLAATPTSSTTRRCRSARWRGPSSPRRQEGAERRAAPVRRSPTAADACAAAPRPAGVAAGAEQRTDPRGRQPRQLLACRPLCTHENLNGPRNCVLCW